MSQAKTKVEFYYHEKNKDLFAFFPEIKEGPLQYACYSHVGQHSTATAGYVAECRPATAEEFKSLACELIGIGYTLSIQIPQTH